ncbi:MAG: hypothetical protein K2W82_10740 [Candidatus Obscuribacterales bacterium]|nr:hypothetical protein [Candidatus Obscuribacterales bacterium]
MTLIIRKVIVSLITAFCFAMIFGIAVYIGAGIFGWLIGQTLAWTSAKAGAGIGAGLGLGVVCYKRDLSVSSEINFLIEDLSGIFGDKYNFITYLILVSLSIILGRWLF